MEDTGEAGGGEEAVGIMQRMLPIEINRPSSPPVAHLHCAASFMWAVAMARNFANIIRHGFIEPHKGQRTTSKSKTLMVSLVRPRLDSG